ncbi:MAG: hypothetical protein ACM4AI_13445 [Acidobacteriota bacterium]
MIIPLVAALLIGASPVDAERRQAAQPPPKEQPAKDPAINVNWLYGAYVPKEVPLEPLSGTDRRRLWTRQTFLTIGIYAKTGLFALWDQANDEPPEWDKDVQGFGQRFASRYGQFMVQNSVSAAGNWALGYEPRYERCRCEGKWRRVRHALVRNFVTYNSTERERRPQLAMYAGAWVGGIVASTWKPAKDDIWEEGYGAMLTQVGFGSLANIVGEFAVEIGKLLGRK